MLGRSAGPFPPRLLCADVFTRVMDGGVIVAMRSASGALFGTCIHNPRLYVVVSWKDERLSIGSIPLLLLQLFFDK